MPVSSVIVVFSGDIVDFHSSRFVLQYLFLADNRACLVCYAISFPFRTRFMLKGKSFVIANRV